MLTYLAATWLGLNAGITTALAAAYRRHNRHLTERADFDRHVDEALAVAASYCDRCGLYDSHAHPDCPGDREPELNTPLYDTIRDLMADLAELRAVETVEDALYLWGDNA